MIMLASPIGFLGKTYACLTSALLFAGRKRYYPVSGATHMFYAAFVAFVIGFTLATIEYYQGRK